MIRPPGRVTRTICLATSSGFGANMAPKMLIVISNVSSANACKLEASPSWKEQLLRPAAFARLLPAATRLLAISTPVTMAPSFAEGSAVVPSPQPTSSTCIPLVIPSLDTSMLPLSRMISAMRLKSPFSHNCLFGFISVCVLIFLLIIEITF